MRTFEAYNTIQDLFHDSDSFETKRQITSEVLESLVDRFDVAIVLSALADVASEKANHLRSNWQDKSSARSWDATANKINKLVDRIA